MKTLIVIGYGNMAKAILSQNVFIKAHYHTLVAGRNITKIHHFIDEHCPYAEAYATNMSKQKYRIDCQDKDVLLCIKPKAMEHFIFEGRARCVYSVLAGVGIESLSQAIKAHYIIRLMPNIAAHSKLSATAFYCHKSENALNDVDSILQSDIKPFIESFGTGIMLDNEELIESSIATSGSGIAFLALVAESLIDAGVLEGLTHAQSLALVRQSFVGFADILKSKSPSELKYAISSPGGTTIRGLSALEQNGIRGAFINAAHISAQYARDLLKDTQNTAQNTSDKD